MMGDPASTATVHLPVRPEWLAKRHEAALCPDMPIVDPHHHFWIKGNDRYMAAEFLADIADNNVRASVFVECRENYRPDGDPDFRPIGETEFVVGIVERQPDRGARNVCAGIVGYADLRIGDRVKSVLEAHVAAGNGRFRGIRNISAWHPDPAARGSTSNPPPDLLRQPEFRKGFAHLAPLGLTFDAYMYHTQLSDLHDLARTFPDTPIVINHAGGMLGIGPYRGKRTEVFADWRAKMATLAANENVFVKIGGLGLRAFGLSVHEETLPPKSETLARLWRSTIETCIELFGTKRCMFESNFPVDKGSCSYTAMWNAYKRVTAEHSGSERDDLFRKTATRFYKLPGFEGIHS
jgi:predicted TIM-barrel fold metal-dependent hydrolase